MKYISVYLYKYTPYQNVLHFEVVDHNKMSPVICLH